MFLTVHAPVGAFVGAAAGGPVGAFVLGVLSHFILDMIPHGDEHIGPPCAGPTCTHCEEIRFIARLGVLDAIIMGGVLLTLFTPWRGFPTMNVIAGMVGGVLPDILQGLASLYPKYRLLAGFKRIHDIIHVRIIPWESPVLVGMATQLATLVAVIVALRA